MPKLSLNTKLDRLLAESHESTRYVDSALQLRRLTLSTHVPAGTKLQTLDGVVFTAGEVADDGKQPVHSEVVGKSATVDAGCKLVGLVGDGIKTTLEAETICTSGGVWDTQRREFRRDANNQIVAASRPVRVDLMESQIEAGRWLAERVAAFRDQRPHPQAVAELFSDRRAGKTFVGVLGVLLVAFTPVTGSLPLVSWFVSTSHAARDELDRIVKAILPPHLYTYRELPKREFVLLSGAKILHKTTDDVESLRVGYVDIALLNEAANMPRDAYSIVLRATQDHAGFLVLTTNTPKRSKGAWVVHLAEGAAQDEREGRIPAVKVLRLDPKQNAAISQGAKSTIDRALLYTVEEDELDEGVILEADAKLLAPPFDPLKHVRAPFGLVDVTATFLSRITGRPFQYLAGADFQQQCAAVVFKIYAPDAESLDRFVFVAVASYFLRGGGDEDDLIDCLEADNYTSTNTHVIGDCSGQWQKGDHGYGPVSFETFKRRGYSIVGPTTKKSPKGQYSKNPDVEASVGRLRTFIADDRLLVSPSERTKALETAIFKCEARVDVYANLHPKGIHAHLIDATRYPQWWATSKATAATQQLPQYVLNARR